MDSISAFPIVNGFCSRNCQDSYMCSVLVATSDGVEIGIPTTSDISVFNRPPWELPIFFRQELLPNENSRCWIFRHGAVPAHLTRMTSFYKWSFDKYESIILNENTYFVRHIKLTYVRHNAHADGALCHCHHDFNASRILGWKLLQYRFGAHSVFCLSFNRMGPKVLPLKSKSDKKSYDRDDGGDGSDGEDVVDKSSYQFMSQRDLPLKKRSVEAVAPREEPTGVGHKHEDTVCRNSRLPDSLCYIDPTGRLNDAYLGAIVEVGEVLQFYDSEKRLLACGFRARVIDIPVSHCFNLNRSSTYCEVDGTQVIMNAYNGALFNVSSAGRTLFGPLINAAATVANKSLAQNARICYVLLIITDGVMTGVQETKDSLVSASDLPLSILIVGVGRAEYKEAEVLDGDKGERLEHSSSRDMVQFVA